jgi:hypothetical protein
MSTLESPVDVFPSSGIWAQALTFLFLSFLAFPGAHTQTQAPKPERGVDVPRRGDRALIIVGLPGDQAHAASFNVLAATYRKWLTERLEFPASRVRILFGAEGAANLNAGAATRDNVDSEAAAIRKSVSPEDRLWVIIVGHANERAGHVFLHLPGPDLGDLELAKLFEGMTCREQVFLVTTAGSGGFLPGLSAKGRIVITATTADQELNETEFPYALAELCSQGPTELDKDADGKVSLWEVFIKLGQLVEARFAADERTPTEHALLDDNGDRVGIERPDTGASPKEASKPKAKEERNADGELARKTILPLKIP